MKRYGIISVWLKYEIPQGVDVEEYLQNVELPEEYVEDSFEFIKVVKYGLQK